jgi:hypothetical protein
MVNLDEGGEAFAEEPGDRVRFARTGIADDAPGARSPSRQPADDHPAELQAA